MLIVKIIFWISLFIVFYSYAGYGIILWILVKFKENFRADLTPPADFTPPVALIIAAFNEEDYIKDKIANTIALRYPSHLLNVVFVTDGSSDRTPDVVRENSRYQVLHEAERRGKTAAMNRGVKSVTDEILVFCDANTALNPDCINEIVKHYTDPLVGAVAGEKKIMQMKNDQITNAGEGLYWKYESFLKQLDSRLYSVVGAAGELFSIRRNLYEPVPDGTIIEDFVMSLNVCRKGFVVRYEPRAYATETASATLKDEQKRKIRIAAGGFQAMAMLKELLNIFKWGTLSFQYISHRVLRWTICPLLLAIIFITNLWISIVEPGPIYHIFLALQFAFYAASSLGWIFAYRNIKNKWFYTPYYFLFMNWAVVLGFKRYLKGQQSVLWDKAARQKLA